MREPGSSEPGRSSAEAGSPFDYALVRVVPRVERGELINAGVIVFCSTRAFLDARVELDRARLAALCPDCDVALIEQHLAAIPRICRGGAEAGPIGLLEQRQRFHWLVAPRSTIVQPGPVHVGVDGDPAAALRRLFERLVKVPAVEA